MIRILIDLYILVLIADVILSYLPQFKNQSWAKHVTTLVNYSCDPIRKLLPSGLPFDFSPLIVILILNSLYYLLASILP